jgi:hypothetical protein
MRWFEIIGETASAGSSAAGNIATVPGNSGKAGQGSIGAGFDPDGHQGIYQSAKNKSKKTEGSNILRR